MRPALLLGTGLALLILSLSSGWMLQQDASARLVVARQLWQKHTVFIDTPRPERFVRTPQGQTTYFGIGQSLLFIPFDLLGATLMKVPFLARWWDGHIQLLPFLLLYLPLVALSWWFALLKLLRALGSRDEAAWATVYFLTSAMVVYSAQTFQEEAVLGALATWSLAESLDRNRNSRGWSLFQIGFVAATCLLFRLNAVFVLLPLAAMILSSRPGPRLGYFFLGALFPLTVYGVFSYWRFGSPWATGYDLSYAQLLESGTRVWRAPDWSVALGLLLGPGKGFLFTSPLLVFALLGWREAWRERPHLWSTVALALFANLIFHSCLRGFSCGGHSWGGRFQMHFLGLFAYPAWLGFQKVWTTASGKLLSSFLFLLSLGIQALAIQAPESLEYHQEMAVHGDYQERLITSLTEGQIPLRVANVVRELRGQPVFPAQDPAHTIPILENTRRHHMPNLWGFSYAEQSTPRLPWRLLWTLIFSSGVVLIALGLFRSAFSCTFRSIFEMSSRHLKRLSLDLVSRRLSS